MHVVFQTAVRKSADQDFSPKNANLGTFGNHEIFRGILKIEFLKVVLVKYMRFSGPKQNIPLYF
jgi:hypothetical protein